MGVAANVFATIESVIEIGAQTEATRAAATASAIAAQANEEIAATEMPEEISSVACTELEEVDYEVIEGPTLTPEQGYYYIAGSPKPEIYSSWLVRNTGTCVWENISFLSLFDGRIITPDFRQDGEDINLLERGGKLSVGPDDEIEILVPYELTQARNVNDEFIVMVNGISLVSLPHTIIQVNGWVITIQQTSNSTPTPQASNPNKPPGGEAPPPGRPTPTSPPDRDE